MLDGPAIVLDVRSERAWDEGHITKPPRKSVNVPFAAGDDGGEFLAAAGRKLTNRNAAVLVVR